MVTFREIIEGARETYMGEHDFYLTYDPNPSPQYPHGYWYANSSGMDASGPTVEATLANLIAEMARRIRLLEADLDVSRSA